MKSYMAPHAEEVSVKLEHSILNNSRVLVGNRYSSDDAVEQYTDEMDFDEENDEW